MDTIELLSEISVLKERLSKSVEVVRCKECKRWTDMGEPWGECRWSEVGNITLATTPDDYCSNGVRK